MKTLGQWLLDHQAAERELLDQMRPLLEAVARYANADKPDKVLGFKLESAGVGVLVLHVITETSDPEMSYGEERSQFTFAIGELTGVAEATAHVSRLASCWGWSWRPC
jgi:hypothetical protein